MTRVNTIPAKLRNNSCMGVTVSCTMVNSIALIDGTKQSTYDGKRILKGKDERIDGEDGDIETKQCCAPKKVYECRVCPMALSCHEPQIDEGGGKILTTQVANHAQ